MKVENGVRPPEAQIEAFFASAGTPDDGPVALLNLLKFRPHAAYPDGSDAHLTSEEAYMRYGFEVAKLIAALGGQFRLVWQGRRHTGRRGRGSVGQGRPDRISLPRRLPADDRLARIQGH